MLETAGTKLRRARTLRHLSLEDVARATKIRVSQLADLEADDYSNFANLAYAKGFLVGYGKYLHVNVRQYLDAFADASTFGLDDYQYLSEAPVGVYRAPTRPWRKRRQGNARQLLAGAAALVLMVVVVFGGYLYVGYRRLGDLNRLAERQAARDRNEPAASTTADASPAPGLVPVAATPEPAVTEPETPEIAPSNEDNRAAATALAVSEHGNSPAALLTQLALPSIQTPVSVNPASSPAPGGKPLLVHRPEKNGEGYRPGEPKPQKVANGSLE